VLSPEGLVSRAVELARTPERSGVTLRTILVVDDAVTSRLLYRSFLESAGYRVVLASEGEEALELMQRGNIDAVITDARMPRMDGFELTRRLRRLPGGAELPILLVTSLASEEDRHAGLLAGATAYLVKTETPPEKVLDVLGGFVR
jgi:two-component system chemotaxis sensor kinase CheA